MSSVELLNSYGFWIVALGTTLLAMTAALVGALNVFRGQSLIGDAIGHAAFPGIVFAFMLFMTRSPLVLLAGAMVFGALAFSSIQFIHEHSRLKLDALLAIVLSSFFGLGMVFKSYIQGNPSYTNASQSGLQNYIFGQAAYIGREDARWIALASILCLLLLLLFYRPFKVYLFDLSFAHCLGYRPLFLNGLLLLMTILLIALGLKSVGAVLISSLLVAPIVTARLWSSRLSVCLLLSALFAGFAAFLGTTWSTLVTGLPTGAGIIVILTGFSLFSLFFAPRGLVWKRFNRKDLA